MEKDDCELVQPPSKPVLAYSARPRACAPKSATICSALRVGARENICTVCAQVKLASGRKPASSHTASSTRPRTKGRSSVPGPGARPALWSSPGVEAKWMASVAASTHQSAREICDAKGARETSSAATMICSPFEAVTVMSRQPFGPPTPSRPPPKASWKARRTIAPYVSPRVHGAHAPPYDGTMLKSLVSAAIIDES